jgi:predicted O-linked N-acetylglucosamine transferase (SPINDLY family)
MPQKIKHYTNPFLKTKGPLIPQGSSALPNLQNAIALHQQGQLGQAEAIYLQLLQIQPKNADALHLLGVIAYQTGHHQRAVDIIGLAIGINPNAAIYYSNRGNAFKELKQLDAVVSSCDKAIELKPDFAEAFYNRGNALKELKQLDTALASYNKAIALKPDYADAYLNQGNALQELKQLDAALTSFDKAIELKPDYAEAHFNRGNSLKELKQFVAAVVSYDKAIELKPDYAEAYFNRGVAMQELKQIDAALASYLKAIKLKPGYAEAYSNRGLALQELKQLGGAISSYDKAIELKPDYAEAYYNRGLALQELKQLDAAVASYDKAIELKPDYDYLFGLRLHTKMHLCDWQEFERNVSELGPKIQSNVKASTSFSLLSLPIVLADQLKSAEIWNIDKFPPIPSLGPINRRSRQLKIRIAYYSPDFRSHPVSSLAARLFEYHDRSKFELFAFFFGSEKRDEVTARIEAAFDQFIDVRKISDMEIAALSRKLGIDIAIDLAGHTQDCRTGIFSYRAAPIQVNYLGYPATMGAEYMDYIVADGVIIEEKNRIHYTEKIAYMPHSYLVGDPQREISQRIFTRLELGLPESGFIFCCFNASYKINPPVFDVWAKILQRVRGSVLWLSPASGTAVENLRKEAASRGLDPQRLIFSNRIDSPAEHLARVRVADLFLDTWPFNAHSTAIDALWAGVPLITCRGETFASRVAASLLKAIELPELVTEKNSDYEALAIELATNPAKLREIKDKLERNRLTTPLFDTAIFAKHIETAYIKMYERYQADLLPDHIYINVVDTKDKT